MKQRFCLIASKIIFVSIYFPILLFIRLMSVCLSMCNRVWFLCSYVCCLFGCALCWCECVCVGECACVTVLACVSVHFIVQMGLVVLISLGHGSQIILPL